MFPINRVLHGDCARILKQLPDEQVDFIVTDPPYGVRYKDRLGRTIANDDDPSGALAAFLDLYRVLKPNSLCVSFYGWSQVDAFFRVWRAAGFQPVGHIVFAKPYASRTRFLRYRHEQAYLLAKGRPALPRQPLDDIQPWTYSGNFRHPTEKDVSVLKPLIECFTRPGDLILDPFAGSGSALVSAALTGRRYLGIELSEEYCARARQWLARVERRRAPSVAMPPIPTPASLDWRSTVMLDGLFQWLREREYHGLARTVQGAIGSYRP